MWRISSGVRKVGVRRRSAVVRGKVSFAEQDVACAFDVADDRDVLRRWLGIGGRLRVDFRVMAWMCVLWFHNVFLS